MASGFPGWLVDALVGAAVVAVAAVATGLCEPAPADPPPADAPARVSSLPGGKSGPSTARGPRPGGSRGWRGRVPLA